jgi:hypothetical protein
MVTNPAKNAKNNRSTILVVYQFFSQSLSK